MTVTGVIAFLQSELYLLLSLILFHFFPAAALGHQINAAEYQEDGYDLDCIERIFPQQIATKQATIG